MTVRKNFVLKFVLSLMAGFMFIACSSAPKGDIAGTANPQDEISKLESEIQAARLNNVDVLAPNDFNSSGNSLNEAKSALAKGAKQEAILDGLRESRGYLNKANAHTGNRADGAPTLFEARQAAMKAGAADRPELGKDLRKLDSETSKLAENLSKAKSEDVRKLQNRYVDMERRAVTLTQLGAASAIVNGAKKDKAAKRAPKTLKAAELALNAAETTISSSVRNPQGYQASVVTANERAGMLKDVMTTIAQNGKTLSENAAVSMVTQNRQIKNLKTDLKASTAAGAATQAELDQSNDQIDSQNDQIDYQNQKIGSQAAALVTTGQQLDASDRALMAKSDELDSKDAELDSANSKVDIQRAIETARAQFSPNDAEAYQQGGNLLIRLKNIGFASGRSELPTASLAMLAKVSAVAKSLNASEIKVEGHTDSVGGKAQNKTISDARANAVATYFKANGFGKIGVESTGYGFEKPIATNKSVAGRAQNRRVDIIITPTTSTQ